MDMAGEAGRDIGRLKLGGDRGGVGLKLQPLISFDKLAVGLANGRPL